MQSNYSRTCCSCMDNDSLFPITQKNTLLSLKLKQDNRALFSRNTESYFSGICVQVRHQGVQNQQKIKLPPVGIEFTTTMIYGL